MRYLRPGQGDTTRTADAAGARDGEPTERPTTPKHRRSRLRRWLLRIGAVMLVLFAAAAWYVWRQYRMLTSSKYNVIAYTVPRAPHLAAASGETVYRIDPTHSSLGYAVDESLFGHSVSRAEGDTHGIAGEIALNRTDPSRSRVGQIVVNLEQLHSDNHLRDAQIRARYLESHRYPLVYLTVGDLHGLPHVLVEGRQYHFRLPSQVTLRRTPVPVVWDAKASLAGGRLTATATTKVKMSTLGIGPISVAGLVSTSNDVDLTMKVTALDPSRFTVPTTIAPPPSAPRSGDSPSFARVVLPAMESNCASCHQSGEVGAGHWTFDTARDARRVADGIGTVVQGGYMPPWPAGPASVAFTHSKQLDPRTRAAIVKWSHAGGPLDVAPATKVKVRRGPAAKTPRHDVVMSIPAPYAGPAGISDDYRCFLLDPHLTRPTYLTGYDLMPDQRAEIHHAQLFQVTAAKVAGARARSGADGLPGWGCYVGATDLTPTKASGLIGQSGLLAVWNPGEESPAFPLHSGVLFQPGDQVILQMHYHYDGAPVPDQTKLGLQLDPVSAAIRPYVVVNPVAPVEIPCVPGDTAPLCNRDAAIAEAGREYGPFGAALEPGLLGICHRTQAELTATFTGSQVSSSCDTEVPVTGRLAQVAPHMHTLGRRWRLTLDPGTPRQRVILDIPTWNWNWQLSYDLARPIHVTAGDTMQIDCTWDRTLDPNRPSKYIVFAEGTRDEMCFGTYGIVADDPGTATTTRE
jgi:polyisoprenoid-binding protein YceI/mono/diheme cytochrome c family protein